MSKFFENLANVGSAAGGVGSLVSGVSSLFGSNGAKQQYEYQRKLNEQQQQYARENALLDYQRTRELTADKFQLEKQGKRAAGISTSFTDGSSASAAAVNGVAAPNAGSISLAQNFSERMAQSASMLSSGASLLRENMLAQRQSENLSLDADLKRSTMLPNIQKAKAGAENEEQRARYQRLENDILEDLGYRKAKAETEDAENKAGMSSIQYKYFEQMTLADLQNKLADTQLKLKNRDLSDEQRRDLIRKQYVYQAEIKLKEEQAKVVVPTAQSQITLNKSIEDKNYSEKYGVELDNDLKEMTNYNKSRLIEQMYKTQFMRNAPTTIQEQIKEAIYDANQGVLTPESRKIAVRALDILIKQEANQRGNKNTQSNIETYQMLKDWLNPSDYINIIK